MSTIKQKIGQCPDCDNGIEVPLIAGRCQSHYWSKQREKNAHKIKLEKKVQTKIPKFSAKRKIENREYLIKRLNFLAQPENQICFIEGCRSKADTIEHRAGRIGSNYLDVSTWSACCNFHNLELERNPELSQKYQLSKITGKEKLKK